MTDAALTPEGALDLYPPQRRINHGSAASQPNWQDRRNVFLSTHKWAREFAGTRAVSGGQSSDGASQTIAVYQIDLSTANVIVGTEAGNLAALNDVDLLLLAEAMGLDGAAPVALTADGQTYIVVLCALLIADVPTLFAVFGAEAADTAEVKPDAAAIRAALVLADPTDYDQSVGLVLGEILIQRTAIDTMVFTHTAITTQALELERAQGTLGGLPTDSGLTRQQG